MARPLALGSYVARQTPIHRIDARVKLAVLLALTVASFATSSPVGVGILAAALAACLALSGVSWRSVARGVRPAAVVLAFSVVANTVVLVGQPDIVIVGGLGASVAGLVRSVLAVARIVLLVGFALVVSVTTMPTQVADAVGWALSPLARLGVPVGDVSMSVSIALRFIPVTAEEIDRMAMSQRARGVRFDQGGLIARARRWASLLVPLMVALLRRSDELALAMGDRCYTGEGRTRMTGRMRPADWAALVLGLAASVAVCMA